MRYDAYSRVDLEHLLETYRPVVEAAKAFIAESPNTMMVPWHDLRRAVEALQEARDE